MSKSKFHRLMYTSQTESRRILYTESPTEDLDFHRLLDGRPDYFRIAVQAGALIKKQVIITDPSFAFGFGTTDKLRLWLRALEAGFEISVWEGKLSPVRHPRVLLYLLKKVQPVAHADLKKILAEQNIASDACYLAGISETWELQKDVLDLTIGKVPVHIDLLPADKLLNIPEETLLQILRCIPDDAKIGLEFRNSEEADSPLFRDFLSRNPSILCHADYNGSLPSLLQANPGLKLLRSPQSGTDFSNLSLPPSLEELSVACTSVTTAQFATLIEACSRLKLLIANQCRQLDVSQINLPGSLRHLFIESTPLIPETLETVLLCCPHLETLSLGYSNSFKGLSLPLPLPASLRRLYLGNTAITGVVLAQMLHSCPGLEMLHFGFSSELVDISGLHLPSLKNLSLQGCSLTAESLARCLQSCTKLEILDLSFCKIQGDIATVQLPASLRYLNLSHNGITGEQLAKLLPSCLKLEVLKLESRNKLDMSAVQLPPSLKELYLPIYLSPGESSKLLDFCPGLEVIQLSAGRLSCSGGGMPELTKLILKNQVTQKQLISWITVAHNLREITIPSLEGMPLTSEELTSICKQYPDITIICPNFITPDLSAQNPKPELRLDANTGPGQASLTARQIFQYKDRENPHPASYRMNILTNFGDKNLTMLTEYIHQTDSLELLQKQEAGNPCCFLGQMPLSRSQDWLSLPGLGYNDVLTHLQTTPSVALEVAWSTSEARYYVKPIVSFQGSIKLAFLLKKNPQNTGLHKPSEEGMFGMLSALHFESEEQLQNSATKAMLERFRPEKLIPILYQYCSGFQEKPLKNPGKTPVDLLNAILRQRAGVCRHRSLVFFKLATAFNIPVRLVSNEVHAFVEVFFQGAWYSLDLGGAEVPLRITALPGASKTLAADNPFRTWDSLPIKAKDMADYAEKLLQKGSSLQPGSQNILCRLTPDQILPLYSALLREKKAGCYFIADLDDVQEQSSYIDNQSGEIRKDLSPLARFLTFACPGDVLLVDWISCESRHVGYNSIMDNPRKIRGMAIPKGVLVVGLLDSEQGMGEDFYSRFRLVSTLPAGLSTSPILPQPGLVSGSPGACVVDFYDEQWRPTLLGNINAAEGRFQFQPSPFLRAMNSGQRVFCFKNAPWHLPEFAVFMTRILNQRQIQAHSFSYTLPQDFELLRDDSPWLLSHPRCTFEQYPCGLPPYTTILNAITFPGLFQSYKTNSKGEPCISPGLLDTFQGEALTFLVTDKLSEAQWTRFLRHAQRFRLHLILAPGIVLPQAFAQKIQSQSFPLHSFTKGILSNDADFSAENRSGVCIIRIHENSSPADVLGCMVKTDSQPLRLHYRQGPLTEALMAGKQVLLKGPVSPLLAKALESLFLPYPCLQVNGEYCALPGGAGLTLLTEKPLDTALIAYHQENWSGDEIWKRLEGQFLPMHVYQLRRAISTLAPLTFRYTALKSLLQYLQARPDHNPLKSLLRLRPDYPALLPRINQAWKTARIITKPMPLEIKRQQLLANVLAKSWYAFVTGPSGAGKSTTILKILKTMNFELVNIEGSLEDKLLAWLLPGTKKALFIDEANLFDAAAFDLLEGLYENPPCLLIRGQSYPVPPENRLVFAGNLGHVEGRQSLNFIARHGHIIAFRELGEVFLRENILGLTCAGLRITDPREIEAMHAVFLKTSCYINAENPANPLMTARNLQMMAMRYACLRQDIHDVAVALWMAALDEIAGICKPEQYKKFRSWIEEQTGLDLRPWKKFLKARLLQSEKPLCSLSALKTRVNPLRVLNQLMQIRENRLKNPGLIGKGTSGLLIEGGPGIGKSYLAIEYLRAQGFVDGDKISGKKPGRCYYHIQSADPDVIKANLRKAFHEGAVVIIDEINTLSLEYCLNAFLSGKTPEGEDPKHPGFFVIGTQNPVSFGKRQPLSEALSNRFHKLCLKDYSHQDLTRITGLVAKTDTQSAEILVTAFIEARNFAREQQLRPEPVPRDLFETAKNLLPHPH